MSNQVRLAPPARLERTTFGLGIHSERTPSDETDRTLRDHRSAKPPAMVDAKSAINRLGTIESSTIETDLRTGLARAAAAERWDIVQVLDRQLTELLEARAGVVRLDGARRGKQK